jgi:hypothetical protein
MRINVKINTDLFFECRFEFPLQIINKLSNPTIVLIIFLTVADENLPAGRQVSYSKPGMMLAILVNHCVKVMKDNDTSQIKKLP